MLTEEVTERSRIIIPKDISLREAEKLLRYLAESLQASVNYQVSYYRTARHENGKVIIDRGTVEIAGGIAKTEIPFCFDSFTLKSSERSRDTSRLSRMQFQLIPGYDEFSDYRPEIVQLWDDVRGVIKDYFSRREKSK